MSRKWQKVRKESDAKPFYYRNEGMDFPRCQGDCVNRICSGKTTGIGIERKECGFQTNRHFENNRRMEEEEKPYAPF